MIKFILILSLLFPSISNAVDCKADVQVIKAGEVAQCDGFLFSREAERRAAQGMLDAKYYKDLSDLLHDRNELANKEIKILDERLNLYMSISQTLAEQVNRKEREDFWQKLGYFVLGSAVMYGASQIYR